MRVFNTFLVFLFLCAMPCLLPAQGTTNTNLSGKVVDETQNALSEVVIIIRHTPSNTQYGTITDKLGNFYFRNIRIGGPYEIIATAFGFSDGVENIEHISLNATFQMTLILKPISIDLDEVVIFAESLSPPLSIQSSFSQNIDQSVIASLPNINNSFISLFELSPLSNGESFSGKNPRFNLISLDGAVFTNSFGLGNTSIIGAASGAQPFSIDAIEEVQFNHAPYDLSQSGFTGARINIVTKKGDNKLMVSSFTKYQDKNFIRQVNPGISTSTKPIASFISGLTVSGPISKDNLFYFFNYETLRQNQAATNFIANKKDQSKGNTSRVLEEDLKALSDFLLEQYNYETGKFQDYPKNIKNDKLLLNLDWNINRKHKLNIRYNSLISRQENVLSNSLLVGNGARNNNPFSMSFENSDWVRSGNLQSLLLELNSQHNSRLTSRLSLGYTRFNEKRTYNGTLLPLVDILKNGRNYISFGTDPFAPGNKLLTNILQSDGGIYYPHKKQELEAGYNVEYLSFTNVFTPAFQGVYVYDALSDFYNSTVLGTINPMGISTGEGRPVLYQKGISAKQSSPSVKPSILQFGGYVQDKIKINEKIQLNIGSRIDRIAYLKNPLRNPEIESLTFQDEDGNPLFIRTDQLPKPQVNISARLGFLVKLIEKNSLQIRGGTGIFLGNIPYVFIADQFQNNGILYQNISLTNTENISFSIDTNEHLSEVQDNKIPYDMAAVAMDFNLPKIWRSTFGGAYQFTTGLKTTLDFMYSQDLNAVTVSNINIDNKNVSNHPIDGRTILSNPNLNPAIISKAYFWQNANKGSQQGVTIGLSKKFGDIANTFLSYTWSQTKEINSIAGTNASSAFKNMAVAGNPNEPILSYSQFDQPHKLIAFSNFKFNWIKDNLTSCTIVGKAIQKGRFSYTYAGMGDVNNDGITSNDLIFIPSSINQIHLAPYPDEAGNIISEQAQWTALNSFISNSTYLNSRRGKFAERYGAILPWLFQVDLRIEQALKFKNNLFSFSIDVLNFTNLLNKNWGRLEIPTNVSPIEAISTATFRVYPQNLNQEFVNDNQAISYWQIQLGLRYSFVK